MVCFLSMTIIPSQALAQGVLGLPVPGTMVSLSPVFTPTILRGIRVYPNNSLKFDFIVDSGDTGLTGTELKSESERLIKYFLAALTIPEDNLWVNLSPYEKDRIIPDSLASTDMGTDMLAQDYILKQVTASLMYPEDELGKQFWQEIYKKAYEEYGTTNIPVDTFNKVWIMPEYAEVYVKEDRAFVVQSKLKIMLEEDYLALEKSAESTRDASRSRALDARDVVPTRSSETLRVKREAQDASQDTLHSSRNKLASDIVREIIIPALEKEVNTGRNFAQLRQIYNSLILAYWFKNNLKESIVNKVYSDQSKIKGVDTKDVSQDIYNQYVESFKKGVCDLIKIEYDQFARKHIPRKYFSGGVTWELDGATTYTYDPYRYVEEIGENADTTYIATAELGDFSWKSTATEIPIFTSPQVASSDLIVNQLSLGEKREQELPAFFITYDDLLKKIQEAGYKNFGDMTRKVIHNKEENMIAEWGSTEVIEVPGLEDEFCLKLDSKEWKLGPPEMIEDIMPGYNVGQPIAKVGNILILRRQRGRQAGIHEDIKVKKRHDVRALRIDYIEYLQKVAEMPQSAFNKLVHIMSALIDRGYQIDAGANTNLLVDFKAKGFPVVDVMPRLDGAEKSLLGLVSMLIDANHLVDDYKINPISKVLETGIQSITKKLIKGFYEDGIEKELPSLKQFKTDFDEAISGLHDMHYGEELKESAFDELYGTSLDDILLASSSQAVKNRELYQEGIQQFFKNNVPGPYTRREIAEEIGITMEDMLELPNQDYLIEYLSIVNKSQPSGAKFEIVRDKLTDERKNELFLEFSKEHPGGTFTYRQAQRFIEKYDWEMHLNTLLDQAKYDMETDRYTMSPLGEFTSDFEKMVDSVLRKRNERIEEVPVEIADPSDIRKFLENDGLHTITNYSGGKVEDFFFALNAEIRNQNKKIKAGLGRYSAQMLPVFSANDIKTIENAFENKKLKDKIATRIIEKKDRKLRFEGKSDNGEVILTMTWEVGEDSHYVEKWLLIDRSDRQRRLTDAERKSADEQRRDQLQAKAKESFETNPENKGPDYEKREEFLRNFLNPKEDLQDGLENLDLGVFIDKENTGITIEEWGEIIPLTNQAEELKLIYVKRLTDLEERIKLEFTLLYEKDKEEEIIFVQENDGRWMTTGEIREAQDKARKEEERARIKQENIKTVTKNIEALIWNEKDSSDGVLMDRETYLTLDFDNIINPAFREARKRGVIDQLPNNIKIGARIDKGYESVRVFRTINERKITEIRFQFYKDLEGRNPTKRVVIFGISEQSGKLVKKTGKVAVEDSGSELADAEAQIVSSPNNSNKDNDQLKGGIDFNDESMNVTTKGDSINFNVPLDIQNITSSSIEGFVPIIINIAPVTDFMGLLGLDGSESEPEQYSELLATDPKTDV
ncbi:MAG: hypothetical protein PHY73_07395 [Candidatus Omnitrophica bacterium]|nr:hypothetical protein [Candidatus Omnitrophota bacterium]